MKFHTFFVRYNGRWYLDCSSWDKQELLTVFHHDKNALRDKRFVTLANDDEQEIKKARLILNHTNTKCFVDLSRG